MSTLDEDALATLTPEERSAIEGEDLSPADVDALKSISESSTNSADEDGDDAGAKDAPQKADAKTDADEVQRQDQAGTEAEGKSADRAARYESEPIEQFEEQLKELKSQDGEIRAKYKSGEIDIDERDEALALLIEQREELLVKRTKAETLKSINETNADNEYANFVDGFVQRVKGDGVDYALDKNKRLFNASLQEVMEDQPALTRAQAWDEAHKIVARARGAVIGAQVAQSKKDSLADAVAKRRAPVDAAPKTLAHVPGGDGPGDVGSEFADIEALTGMEYETAIARMSPAQREKFLRS